MVGRARVILIALLVIGGLAAAPRMSAGSGAAAAAFAAAAADPNDQSANVDEIEKLAKVRAAFLLQIIRFTRWPDERFEDEKTPIVVGVPRGSAITPFLLGTFRARTIDERAIIVRELDLVPARRDAPADAEADADLVDATIASCHVLYLPGRDRALIRRAWPVARRAHVLVVAEHRVHLDAGAAIALPVGERSVQLMVNRTCLDASEVGLRSRVMKLATVVDEEVRP